jgi:hypothetical protein
LQDDDEGWMTIDEESINELNVERSGFVLYLVSTNERIMIDRGKRNALKLT